MGLVVGEGDGVGRVEGRLLFVETTDFPADGPLNAARDALAAGNRNKPWLVEGGGVLSLLRLEEPIFLAVVEEVIWSDTGHVRGGFPLVQRARWC